MFAGLLTCAQQVLIGVTSSGLQDSTIARLATKDRMGIEAGFPARGATDIETFFAFISWPSKRSW